MEDRRNASGKLEKSTVSDTSSQGRRRRKRKIQKADSENQIKADEVPASETFTEANRNESGSGRGSFWGKICPCFFKK